MPDQRSAHEEHVIAQEMSAPLHPLPDDPVRVVAEVGFPVARHGYDRVAVDAYVRRMVQVVAELAATRSPEAAVLRAVEQVREEISGILQRAWDTGEQITAQARRDAEDRLEAAHEAAAEIVAAAARRAEELDAEAVRIAAERQRLTDDTRELARQVTVVTDAATQRFPADEPEPRPASEVADPAAAESKAPDLDRGAESRLAELWALAAGQAPNDDSTVVLPPDESGPQRAAATQDDSGEPHRPR